MEALSAAARPPVLLVPCRHVPEAGSRGVVPLLGAYRPCQGDRQVKGGVTGVRGRCQVVAVCVPTVWFYAVLVPAWLLVGWLVVRMMVLLDGRKSSGEG